jgi:hypothetical protein
MQSVPNLTYPLLITYLDEIQSTSSPAALINSLGVPGYAPDNIYNIINLGYWTYSQGPQDAANIWANPTTYFGNASTFGPNDT